ncbi:Structure-specific endonuclease subunit SLX1-like protein [Aphelenchoides fujianensis]|nr:Structure-specific endonuclease subunit SLX1-like protein [Aphelenchoides fujianensis]
MADGPTAGTSKTVKRINISDYCDPIVPKGPKKNVTVQNEFFGVYCLISRNPKPQYKNRCYIGYTVDPNRRVIQHNAGRQHGGANRTDNKRPWDMVCIIHGFPNSVSALRFEWAWQNPHKSKRLRDLFLKNGTKESPFQFKLRIASHMLSVDPWRRHSRTFRWLVPAEEAPFPLSLPAHDRVERGLVQKSFTIVPQLLTDYTLMGNCGLCKRRIRSLDEYLECLNDPCRSQFHVRCWAEEGLRAAGRAEIYAFPIVARCSKCSTDNRWGDLIRRQRSIVQLEAAKPRYDNVTVADGMIPKVLQQV